MTIYPYCFLLSLFLLSSCSSKEEITSFSGTQMTMSWEVKIAEKVDAKQRAQINESISAVFLKVDKIFNNWNPFSEISHLNQMGAHQKIELSSSLAQLLNKVSTLVELTEGRFDPTIEPLQKLYKAAFSQGKLPIKKKIKAAEESVGWEKIHLDGSIFWKDHPKTALDLSAIAKGYAVDLLSDSLAQLGFKNFYVEWGGEIKTSGHYSEERGWRVAIMGHSVIEMNNDAIATSGDLFQKWTIDGITYTHIIDPKTKKPLQISENSIRSAAVKTPSCADSDALATSLMLFPTIEDARLWIEKRKLNAWIIQ